LGADAAKLLEVGAKGAAKAGGEQAAFALVRWIAGKTDGKVAADLSDNVLRDAFRARKTGGAGAVRNAIRAACALCFPAGTLVSTAHGEQAIQTLHVGDVVQAEDPATGKVAAEAVQAVIQDPVSPLVAVDLSDGSAITVTADHPFWVDAGAQLAGAGWFAAGRLQAGDELRTATGAHVMVVGLRHSVGYAAVYTLTVAKDHTFFVGSARVLVHNADGGCGPLLYGPSAGGKLAQLAKEKGWVTLNDFFNGAVHGDVRQFTLRVLDRAATSGREIYFDLTYLEDAQGVLAGTGKYGNSITALELRYIKTNWSRFHNIVKFLKNGVEVAPPWAG